MPTETVWVNPHDGFEGELIGEYKTREGVPGYVLQQLGTKIVHVYRTSRVVVVKREIAKIAPTVERRVENPCVDGSNPSLGTNL
jgi:hypothetical protein